MIKDMFSRTVDIFDRLVAFDTVSYRSSRELIDFVQQYLHGIRPQGRRVGGAGSIAAVRTAVVASRRLGIKLMHGF